MVTDQQYRDVLKKMGELEEKVNQISRQLGEMALRSGIKSPRMTEDIYNLSTKRDVTKYFFEGEKLSKRQLVLELIKKYIEDNNIKAAKDIWKVFPDYIQGSMGVVRRAEDAEQYERAADRYYFDDDKIIFLNDGAYVVCKEWTAKNIRKFLEIADTLGYKIEPIYRD